MSAESLIADLNSRGIRLELNGEKISVTPSSKLTDSDRESIRQHKPLLLARLQEDRAPVEIKIAGPGESLRRAGWRRAATPDSRYPIIPQEIRAKIEAIEQEARRLGWPPELIWSADFWGLPRGLAAVVDADDELGDVRSDYIEILGVKHVVRRFPRFHA
ncbi:MAG: hypothetical protein JO121_06880 [Deltaproteobacteria bacterium]|nr:hypothetical protein [Deltaproteobacteria bacterium]